MEYYHPYEQTPGLPPDRERYHYAMVPVSSTKGKEHGVYKMSHKVSGDPHRYSPELKQSDRYSSPSPPRGHGTHGYGRSPQPAKRYVHRSLSAESSPEPRHHPAPPRRARSPLAASSSYRRPRSPRSKRPRHSPSPPHPRSAKPSYDKHMKHGSRENPPFSYDPKKPSAPDTNGISKGSTDAAKRKYLQSIGVDTTSMDDKKLAAWTEYLQQWNQYYYYTMESSKTGSNEQPPPPPQQPNFPGTPQMPQNNLTSYPPNNYYNNYSNQGFGNAPGYEGYGYGPEYGAGPPGNMWPMRGQPPMRGFPRGRGYRGRGGYSFNPTTYKKITYKNDSTDVTKPPPPPPLPPPSSTEKPAPPATDINQNIKEDDGRTSRFSQDREVSVAYDGQHCYVVEMISSHFVPVIAALSCFLHLNT